MPFPPGFKCTYWNDNTINQNLLVNVSKRDDFGWVILELCTLLSGDEILSKNKKLWLLPAFKFHAIKNPEVQTEWHGVK